MSKAKYDAHVKKMCKQPGIRRYKRWDQLTEDQQAEFDTKAEAETRAADAKPETNDTE